MNAAIKILVALIGLTTASVMGSAPAEAAKLYFGTQEYLHSIQDVDVRGPKGEPLYLGYKYSFHSFILPYRMSDDGYVLGVRGQQSYFRLDEATIKSMQARGQLPTPLPPYHLSAIDYAMGHGLWIAIAVIIGLIPLSMLSKRRRKRAVPHLEEGITRHQSGDLNGAIESYGKAVEVDPKFAAAFHFRGKAYAGLGDAKAAISEHTKAIRIEPKFAEALMERAFLMRETGNFDGAISDFSRVIKLNKEDANAYFNRGLSYLGKNDIRRAIADFSKVIKAAPEFPDAYQQRALAYGRMGDIERAQADHAKARELARTRAAAQPA